MIVNLIIISLALIGTEAARAGMSGEPAVLLPAFAGESEESYCLNTFVAVILIPLTI